jgi:hypothetical protein
MRIAFREITLVLRIEAMEELKAELQEHPELGAMNCYLL